MSDKERWYDEDKADELALALLHLNAFRDGPATRAWKGMPWAVTDRLFEKGLIHDPKNSAKSVLMTSEGAEAAQRFFDEYLGLAETADG